MNESIIYCHGWSRRRKFANQPYSEFQAKELFENRKPFGLLFEKNNLPFCFINFNNKFVYVGFLDDLKREYLGYEFYEEAPQKIFLKEVQFWEYDGNTDEKVKSTRYRFTPDGELGIEEKNVKTKEVFREYAQEKIDSTVLWEDYPEFGHYDNIIKIERDIPIPFT